MTPSVFFIIFTILMYFYIYFIIICRFFHIQQQIESISIVHYLLVPYNTSSYNSITITYAKYVYIYTHHRNCPECITKITLLLKVIRVLSFYFGCCYRVLRDNNQRRRSRSEKKTTTAYSLT